MPQVNERDRLSSPESPDAQCKLSDKMIAKNFVDTEEFEFKNLSEKELSQLEKDVSNTLQPT